MTHHVIYIPGFGDHRPYFQDKLIKLWKIWGMSPIYHPVGWDKKVGYDEMLSRLTKLFDELHSKGHTVSIVGVSAGASIAMNLFWNRKTQVHRAVFISGKLLHPETVDESVFQAHPAFRQSVFDCQKHLDRLASSERFRMMSLFGLVDRRVPVKASKLPDAKLKRVWITGHIPTIYTALIFYSRSIAKFIKS